MLCCFPFQLFVLLLCWRRDLALCSDPLVARRRSLSFLLLLRSRWSCSAEAACLRSLRREKGKGNGGKCFAAFVSRSEKNSASLSFAKTGARFSSPSFFDASSRFLLFPYLFCRLISFNFLEFDAHFLFWSYFFIFKYFFRFYCAFLFRHYFFFQFSRFKSAFLF